jgi:hypothetical protein
MNVKKKVMVFNSANPCQEFVFEGDIIKHVRTFKYFEITLDLDRAVEHLAITSRCLLCEATYYGREITL